MNTSEEIDKCIIKIDYKFNDNNVVKIIKPIARNFEYSHVNYLQEGRFLSNIFENCISLDIGNMNLTRYELKKLISFLLQVELEMHINSEMDSNKKSIK